MARNQSVERFRRLTEEMRREVRKLAVAELNAQADDLSRTIESVAPVHEGTLRTTVRVIPGKDETQVRVIAGGRPTVRKDYDYARADEFGTVNMPAQPFFFPTYRLKKKKMIATMKRRITASIKKRSAE